MSDLRRTHLKRLSKRTSRLTRKRSGNPTPTKLDMSQSEFVRTMVQAGVGVRIRFSGTRFFGPRPWGSGPRHRSSNYCLLTRTPQDELEAVADDIESRLDETLRSCSRKTGFDTADATVGIRLPTVVTMATEPGTDTPSDVTDPIEYFLDDQRYHGKSERTLEAYERVLRRFEAFVRERFDVEAVGAAQRRECMAWIHRCAASSNLVRSRPTPRISIGSTIT